VEICNRKKFRAGMSDDIKPGDYACYLNNTDERTHPAGRKKPNGLGNMPDCVVLAGAHPTFEEMF